jgi:segregation and condensation protein A
VRRLVEYEQMKLGAAKLDALPLMGRDFLRVRDDIDQTLEHALPDVHPEDLRDAWRDILQRARLNKHHTISARAAFGARAHEHRAAPAARPPLRRVSRPLRHHARCARAGGDLHRHARAQRASTCSKLTQAEAFAPIYVRLAYAPT